MTALRKAVLSSLTFLIASASLLMAQGTYTQIDVPGSTFSQVAAINSAGDIVGSYEITVDGYSHDYGFLFSNGVYTTLSVSDSNGYHTYAVGINNAGQILLSTSDGGFLYDRSTQTYTPFNDPQPGTFTIPLAINDAGTIVGILERHNGAELVAFEFDGSNYARIRTPGAYATLALSVNNTGDILLLGQTYNGANTFYLLNQGALTKIGPENRAFEVDAINDAGVLVGVRPAREAKKSEGFSKLGHDVQTIRFPGAEYTGAGGVNDAGTVVGEFYGADLVTHGFIWTPPADAAKK